MSGESSTYHPALTPPTAADQSPAENGFLLDDTDGDSAFEEGSETMSIKSSVLRYRHRHGRTYHSFKADEGVNYWLPNDEREVYRLDLQYNITRMTQDGQLYLCPAGKEGKPLNRVLDVGTGTGVWAIDVGMLSVFVSDSKFLFSR